MSGRVIKFRGVRCDSGEWVYGDLIASDRIGCIEIPEYHHQGMGCGIEDRCITDRHEACEYGYEQAIEDVFQNVDEVDPATIGQFTGLLDSEGVEIYEGDIIQGNPIGDGKPWFEVKFGTLIDRATGLGIESAFYGEMIGGNYETIACISWHSGKVIGNTHTTQADQQSINT